MASMRSSAVFRHSSCFWHSSFSFSEKTNVQEVGLTEEELADADAEHEVSAVLEVYDHHKDNFSSKAEFAENVRAMAADEIEAHLEDGAVAEHKVGDKRPHEN
ncbi:unnamed protein product [Polarella glacialis]|uniref:Uncharacterized protein n=1 Tax=Polarella glacialis TaxID=89957 RepID=A0A813J5R4_POLGL|nr:unnamed protein product [Polarella glacialis]